MDEIIKLRDELYEEDLIFMHGLEKINKLIAKHKNVRYTDDTGTV